MPQPSDTLCLSDLQTVVETHYENDRHDLYIYPTQLEHFPELNAFLVSFNPEDRSNTEEHAHIPYPALLVHAARKWQGSVRSVSFQYR